MGCDKLLLSYEGRPIIDRVIDAWRKGGVDVVVVVIRADHAALRRHLQACPIELAAIDAPLPEMVDTVRAGLGYISEKFSPDSQDVWMLAPADLPTLDRQAIGALLEAYDPHDARILAATYDGRRSHPVLFPWRSAEEAAKLGPDGTIRDLLTENGWRAVPVSQPRPQDVDLPSDLPPGERKPEK